VPSYYWFFFGYGVKAVKQYFLDEGCEDPTLHGK